MIYKSLGRTALKVSPICLGTMNFGPRTSEAESFAILGEALDAGINFVDTANQYGGRLGVGATEEILGRWLAEDRSRRDRIVLATKVHEPMSNDVNDRGLSARHIRMACEASLRRLGTEHIDLYQMHHIDRAAPAEEVFQAMELLIAQGKITYLGSSNFPGWKIAQLCERAAARGRLGLASEQSLYNLIERRVELEVIPACEAYGVGLITWSPLAGGLLAGEPTQASGGRRAAALAAAPPGRRKQLSRFGELCADLGEPAEIVALAWQLHQKVVTSVILGPAERAQLRSALRARDVSLSPEMLDAIDRIFPPIGPSPEAYAW